MPSKSQYIQAPWFGGTFAVNDCLKAVASDSELSEGKERGGFMGPLIKHTEVISLQIHQGDSS